MATKNFCLGPTQPKIQVQKALLVKREFKIKVVIIVKKNTPLFNGIEKRVKVIISAHAAVRILAYLSVEQKSYIRFAF